MRNERLARLLLVEKQKTDSTVSALQIAVRSVSGKSQETVAVVLQDERTYLKALEISIENICPHSHYTEGPHDDSFCDLCSKTR